MNTKTVPQLNSQGLYLGPVEATESPLEPGSWHIPGGAVDAPLPRPLKPLECARFAPDSAAPWVYLPDYSGTEVYSTATGERLAMEPGQSLLDVGGTLQRPDAPAATLQDAQAELKTKAAAMRWRIETSGITVAGVRVATAIEDQNRITSVIANAALAGVQAVDFKAASGWVSLGLAELQGIAASIALHVQHCYSSERAHCEAIDALQTLEAAHAYDVGAGWPSASPQEPSTTATTPQQEQAQP